MTLHHHVLLSPDAPEPDGIGTRVIDGEGGTWERNAHGSWTGPPGTVWREWHRVARIQPLHLLVASAEIPGQEALDVTG